MPVNTSRFFNSYMRCEKALEFMSGWSVAEVVQNLAYEGYDQEVLQPAAAFFLSTYNLRTQVIAQKLIKDPVMMSLKRTAYD